MRVCLGSTIFYKGRLSGKIDGIGHYTDELTKHLMSQPAIEELSFVSFGVSVDQYCSSVNIYTAGQYKFLNLWSVLTGTAFRIEKNIHAHCDVFHSTDHMTPKFDSIPIVSTVMDVIPISHPDYARQSLRHTKNFLFKKSTEWADKIITISEFSKNEIVKHLNVDEQKIEVIPLGIDKTYFKSYHSDSVNAVIQRYALPEQYFIFIGTLQPRKNLDRILLAHEKLSCNHKKQFPLVIVGNIGWDVTKLIKKIQYKESLGELIWLQGVDDFSKRIILSQAVALVFPSLVEGFGLPVLEGFASGVPVIASNTTSLAEIASDSAYLVNPSSVSEISAAMQEIISSNTMAQELIKKGLSRARYFTWEKTVKKTLSVYDKLI
jgi:alpha-1,3-rhamnosyl/mannosyltransferase